MNQNTENSQKAPEREKLLNAAVNFAQALRRTREGEDPSAENGIELAIAQALQLIVQAVTAQGGVDGPMFEGSAGCHHAVKVTRFIADGDTGVLPSFAGLWPMVGVARHNDKKVLVVGPWFISFDQLCLHGFLCEEEAQRLLAAAEKIDRALFRVLCRKNESTRAASADTGS